MSPLDGSLGMLTDVAAPCRTKSKKTRILRDARQAFRYIYNYTIVKNHLVSGQIDVTRLYSLVLYLPCVKYLSIFTPLKIA